MWLNSKAGGAGTWDLYNEQLLGSAVTNGKWTHMALTRDGEYFYFYQDTECPFSNSYQVCQELHFLGHEYMHLLLKMNH